MKIRSLGWRTDVSLRRREGAELEEREDHLVIRTVANPTYRWGNFLLFRSPPVAGEASGWISHFQDAFPGVEYVAIGIDSPAGDFGASGELSSVGITSHVDTVMTASALRPPARESARAELRPVEGDEDWSMATDLRMLTGASSDGPGYAKFVSQEMRAIRRVCEEGRGAWYAAFRDGKVVSSLGIFDAAPRVARFQSVDTHPEYRRQGLASNLLLAASEWASTQLGAEMLVIAADPDYFAIDLYRSLGFASHDHKVYLVSRD